MTTEPDVLSLLGADDEEYEGDNETFQQQALFVPTVKENEDFSGPPMDGFQFLQRVVQERKTCDAIIVKEVKTKPQKNLGKQIPNFPEEKCRPELCMDKETQLHVVSEFSKLRLVCEARRQKIPKHQRTELCRTMPGKKYEEEWLRIFSHPPPNLAETLSSKNSSVELCLAISETKISSIMEFMEDWITEGELSVPLACQWMYTLLTCVETPLDPDLCATLRNIARTLISRRAQLESLSSEELPHINIVICIIGRYFNQLDLADPLD